MKHKPRILILGDSHTVALKKAWEERAGELGEAFQCTFEIHWLQIQKQGRTLGEFPFDEALRLVDDLTSHDFLVLSIAGTAHNILGMLQCDEPFDFCLDEDKAVIDGAKVVPRKCLEDTFRHIISKSARIQSLAERSKAPVAHLSTPPPKADEQFIREHAKSYRGVALSESTLNPPHLRKKMWQLEMFVLQEVCRERGMQFVPAPEAAMKDGGFLRSEFFRSDATHANPAYGRLVLADLCRRRLALGL